ncbi:MAG: hypothetical protein HQL40_20585 [Alphaproteobacteria bacterium]|nr:hypothetical protein [Alphaproteobacteria bacterium]
MSTAPKLPPDETLVILRRIEPTLEAILAEQKEARADLRRHGESIAELRGRLGELSARTPNIWQIVSAVLGINAGIMALGFALA